MTNPDAASMLSPSGIAQGERRFGKRDVREAAQHREGHHPVPFAEPGARPAPIVPVRTTSTPGHERERRLHLVFAAGEQQVGKAHARCRDFYDDAGVILRFVDLDQMQPRRARRGHEPAARAPDSSVPVMAADDAIVRLRISGPWGTLGRAAGNRKWLATFHLQGSPPWRARPRETPRGGPYNRSESREQHLNHGNYQHPVGRRAAGRSTTWSRSWITRKRAVVSVIVMFSLLLVAGGIYGVRLSLALAKTFHTNPISAAIGALEGGRTAPRRQSAPAPTADQHRALRLRRQFSTPAPS